MTPLFVYDTETTGLPEFKKPSEDPSQPHMAQLAAVLVDPEKRTVISSMNVIVRPDGWVIPDQVAAVHGITTEKAYDLGVPEETALQMFLALHGRRHRIAHNEDFDARIIRIGMKRYGWASEAADAWKADSSECTMRLATPIMKLPPTSKMLAAGFTRPKNPNLTEAYKHFTGKDLVGAHDAMNDVMACVEVYFAIKDKANVSPF